MADSVDTMIENSYNRALAWGNWVSTVAESTIHGLDNFDPDSGSFTRKKTKAETTKVAQPKKLAPALIAPKNPTLAQVEELRAALQKMLDDFFDEYFSPVDASSDAQKWLIDALKLDADLKFGQPKIEEIWRDARVHTAAQGNSFDGLTIPAQANYTRTRDVYDAFDVAEEFSLQAAMVGIWEFAASTKLPDLRGDAIKATADYIMALKQTDKLVSDTKTEILNAEAQMRKTAAAWYMAQLSPTLRDVDRIKVLLGERRDNEVTADDLRTKYSELAVKAAIGGAESVAKAAQAATASLNSIISSSTAGFS